MKKTIGIIFAVSLFTIGGVIGWQASELKQYNQYAQSLLLLKEGWFAQQWKGAESAYFSGKWEVSIWAFTNLDINLDYYSDCFNTNDLKYYTFLENARLAKAYTEIGNELEAKNHVSKALANRVGEKYNFEYATNTIALFEVLEKIDRIAINKAKSQSKGSPTH